MENSNTIDIQDYKINRDYYNIGLVIGALRAELENGSVAIEDAYNLLTDRVKTLLWGTCHVWEVLPGE